MNPVSPTIPSPTVLTVIAESDSFGEISGAAEPLGGLHWFVARVLRRSAIAHGAGPDSGPAALPAVYGSSVQLSFLPPQDERATSRDVEATFEAARSVERVIASGGKGATEELGGEGVQALEGLLETMIDEKVDALRWHARGGKPVVLSLANAKQLLVQMRTTRFVARPIPQGGTSRVGLVLLAVGPRGAYEAGALSVLLPALDARGERPRIFVGAGRGGNQRRFSRQSRQRASGASGRIFDGDVAQYEYERCL
jgi:hypothetical protein